MHILVQHPGGERISGVATYVDALSRALESEPTVSIEVIASSTSSLAERIRAAKRADVVHLNSHDLPLALAARILGRRLALKEHYPIFWSTQFDYQKTTFPRRLAREFVTILRRAPRRHIGLAIGRLCLRLLTLALADRRLACSSFLAETCGSAFKVSAVYNPYPVAESQPAVRPGPEINFLFVGRLDSAKGIQDLIEAAGLLSTGRLPGLQRVTIQVVGEGPLRGQLEARVRDLDLQHLVTFRGRIPHADIPRVLASASALIVPSRIEEPSGYVIVEAAAHAVPCIATRKGGIPETAGPSALYYEAGDASALAAVMTRAISDPLLLEKLGVAARQYALENFDLSVAGAAFLTCISSKPADHRMARQHNAPPGARKAQRGATS